MSQKPRFGEGPIIGASQREKDIAAAFDAGMAFVKEDEYEAADRRLRELLAHMEAEEPKRAERIAAAFADMREARRELRRLLK